VVVPLKLSLVNQGFLAGCAAAIPFIVGKVAKYGGSTASNEWWIYILVILTSGAMGALLCLFGRKLLRRDPRDRPDR
jgi:hypothetical protein